jgi:hypothetical protein
MGEVRNECKILVCKPDSKRPLGGQSDEMMISLMVKFFLKIVCDGAN